MTRTSIYLNKEREAAIAADGRSLLELIDAALAGRAPAPVARPRNARSGDCPHPKQRRDAKNPHLCRNCGGYVD
jgi:hypothetical protein